MDTKRDTPFSTGHHHRAPWAGLTFVVGLAALFVALYPSRQATKAPLPPAAAAKAIPAVTLPDFSAIPVVYEKKKAFFGFMKPLIEAENKAIQAKRQELLRLNEKEALTSDERSWIMALADEYRLSPFSPDEAENRQALLERVDTIPLSLAMAQAANESAWGTSRFAREGNNMYGQWVFGKGKGMVPKDRNENASHEVARFDSVSDSIASYLHNLNTLWAYETLRALRREQRALGMEPDGETLALGIGRYSIRGEAYIREIQQLIRYNAPLLSKR